MSTKTAVLLMAYGTPRSSEEILPYYTDIRRGRPPTEEQLSDLKARYDAIGGISPLAARTEAQRDAIIQAIFDHDVAVNVHFQPLPLLTAYKNLGYDIADFPNALDNYSREISLPVYYDLNDEQVATVIEAVCASVHQILGM